MRAVDLPPVASTLLESMRAVGYSFEAAVADIVDNSISAGATEIDIFFSGFSPAYVATLDNGHGMSAADLRVAMRHGSRNPLEQRCETDLGRFGLGLKTASLSQARCLTVASVKDGTLSAARWDLDEVIKREAWTLLELDDDDLISVPILHTLTERTHGTLVVWEKLDRVFAGEASEDRALQDRIDVTRQHLALIFHRFMEGSHGGPPLVIRINGLPVNAADPFLRKRRAGSVVPPETFYVDEQPVVVETHVLPHASKLSPAELSALGGEQGLRASQGFYVYRNFRLITWGTWFRLARQEELAKLARVMVDIPTTLDHLWSLDIKKSNATPPEAVRVGLRRIIAKIADASRRVFVFRGTAAPSGPSVPFWQRIELREGVLRYAINREHPGLRILRDQLPAAQASLFEELLQNLEQSFPVHALYEDMSSDRSLSRPSAADDERAALSLLESMLFCCGPDSVEGRQLIDHAHLLEPFTRFPDVVSRLRERGN